MYVKANSLEHDVLAVHCAVHALQPILEDAPLLRLEVGDVDAALVEDHVQQQHVDQNHQDLGNRVKRGLSGDSGRPDLLTLLGSQAGTCGSGRARTVDLGTCGLKSRLSIAARCTSSL
jgi:hypothetical protein